METTGKICIPIKEYVEGDKSYDNITAKTRLTADEGAFGEIWQACENKDCSYILKYQKFRDADDIKSLPAITKQTIIKEIKLQKAFSELRLAPRVKDSWICDHGGVIVMKALKQTVYSLFKIYEDVSVHYMILASCLSLIRRLHENGYYHGDASISNIMVNYLKDDMEDAEEEEEELLKYKAYNYRFYFIDMGLSGKFDDLDKTMVSEMRLNDYQILAVSIEEKMNLNSQEKTTKDNFSHLLDFMSAYTSPKK